VTAVDRRSTKRHRRSELCQLTVAVDDDYVASEAIYESMDESVCSDDKIGFSSPRQSRPLTSKLKLKK